MFNKGSSANKGKNSSLFSTDPEHVTCHALNDLILKQKVVQIYLLLISTYYLPKKLIFSQK
jgi:hypothetical protein